MGPLNSCCCCIPLKTGVKIMAVLSLIGCAIGIFTRINYLASDQESLKETMDALEELMKKGDLPYFDFDKDKILNAAYYLTIFEVIFYFIWVPVSVLLFLGASKERPDFLLPYLVLAPVAVNFSVMTGLVVCVLMHATPYIYAIYVGSAAIASLVAIYFIVVVYSLFKEFRSIHGDSNISFFRM